MEPRDTIMYHIHNILSCESGIRNAEEAHRHYLKSSDEAKAQLWYNKSIVWAREKDDAIADFLRFLKENFTFTPKG